MKVAFFNVLPVHYGGGLATYYKEMSAGLKKRYKGVGPQIVSLNESAARLIFGMYSVFYMRNESLKSLGKSNGVMANSIPNLGSILSDFDVVYTKSDLLDLTVLMTSCTGRKFPPIIVGFHTPIQYAKTPTIQARMHNSLYSSIYYRSLLSRAAGFHVLNTFHETRLKDMFPKKPVAKIHNPLDVSLYKPSHHTPGVILKVLWVGRLTKDKGCDDLLRLIEEKRRRRIEWTIVGDGAMHTRIADTAKRCNNVAYFPYMNHAKLSREYANHDIFLSTSNWECLPYSVLEAQFCGVPVIANNIPGISDIVITKKTGILCDSFINVSDAIGQFQPSRFDHKKIRSVALERFNPEKSYKQFYRFLNNFHG